MTSPSPLVTTMGDPSGIGPEIIAKTLGVANAPAAVVMGDAAVMERAAALVAPHLTIKGISDVSAADLSGGVVNVVQTGTLSTPPPYGVVSADAGQAAYDAILGAIDLARSGKVSGIVTAPINKEALAAAGLNYPGHTEILADHGGASRVAMMLANDDIKTVLVTIHCALRDAIDAADYDAQMSAIRLAAQGARAFGIKHPRIAVAGLNPHAGEGGRFGREEIDIIAPAIAAAKREGLDVSGPWPGDTVFMQAREGRFDVVVAQYHDQGLIPVKYLGLEKGVNITLGLPFVRTSPDHGTAFDIAGQGIADPTSLQTALSYAEQLATTNARKET